jgi:FMN phosphatase YigB (HAD superfamily)
MARNRDAVRSAGRRPAGHAHTVEPLPFDPRRLRALVFDVDGTLYPHSPLRRAMALRLLRHAIMTPGRGWVTIRALRAYRRAQEELRDAAPKGEPIAAAQMRVACARSGLPESVVAPIVAAWMEQAPLALLSGLVDRSVHLLLEAARCRGMRLAVLSDYPVEAKLRALGLDQKFHVSMSAQDAAVNRFKPHPAGLLEVLRRLDVTAEEALYVGDRHDVDAPTAHAAGVRCVIVGRLQARRDSTWIPAADFRRLHAMLFEAENPPP